MRQRRLGRTNLQVSEVGFGAWAIGGNKHGHSYGPTDNAESLRTWVRSGGTLIAFGGAAFIAHFAILATGGAAAVPLLIGAAAAYQVGKRHRQFAVRAQLALEQTLDRLEFGTTRRLR